MCSLPDQKGKIMKSVIAALLGGIVFGLGLLLSGMGNPAKVQNFLDLAGHWDPSLALVMGGVGLVAFFWSLRHAQFDDLDGAANRILIDDDKPEQ